MKSLPPLPRGAVFRGGNLRALLAASVLSLCIRPFLVAREVSIVVAPQATVVERTAAEELSTWLGQLHPGDRFPLVVMPPAYGDAILLTVRRDEALGGGFRAGAERRGGRTFGEIVGDSPKALLDGVYAVLERAHGQGFYLSGNAREAARGGAFTFDGWEFGDRPLVAERGLMAWPNFLSGCSTWSLDEWRFQVRQLARMRGTHLILHTYANDPLLAFDFEGAVKPVGWINSTRRGRTYAVEHIRDVRNIPGARGLFDDAWFGTEAAKVPDEARVAAARALMRQVFADAHRFGLQNVWAIDVDTFEAQPQEMIDATLSPAETIVSKRSKNWRLVRPDSEGGYAFYKRQLATLLRELPDVDRLVVWVRAPGMSPGMDLAPGDLPKEWRAELETRTAGLAEARDPKVPAAGIYYAFKVAEAWRRALDELGRKDVEVCFGSWSWVLPKFQVAHALFPRTTRFYIKDYADMIGSAKGTELEQVARFSKERAVVPVAYSHHDDGEQCGPPLRLPADFPARMEQAGFAGHAAVVWLTRPLDVYFRSAWDRLWDSGRAVDERATIGRMARDWFGNEAAPVMTDYLEAWWKTAPRFGRETSDEFAPLQRKKGQGLEDRDRTAGADATRLAADTAKRAAPRVALLERAAPLARGEAAKRVEFFRAYEEWTRLFFEAQAARASNDAAALTQRPEEKALAAYARGALLLGPTAGERGQVASLASRWTTFFTEARQLKRREPLRMRFMPTNHDPIARKPGTMTYDFDEKGDLWTVLGEIETGVPVRVREEFGSALGDAWLAKPGKLSVQAVTARRATKLPAGDYTLTLHFPKASTGRLRVIAGGKELGEIDPTSNGGRMTFASPVAPDAEGALRIELETVGAGEVTLSAIVLEPAP